MGKYKILKSHITRKVQNYPSITYGSGGSDPSSSGGGGSAGQEREEASRRGLLLIKKEILGNPEGAVSADNGHADHECRNENRSDAGEEDDENGGDDK